MRIRLRLILPLALASVVAVGFLLAALNVGGAVRAASRDDAASAAMRVILLWGLLSVLVAAVAGAVTVHLISRPLARLQDAVQRPPDTRGDPRPGTRLVEIGHVARGIERAARELHERHDREVRERSALAALVDAVSEGILQLDSEGRIVRVNSAGMRLLGLPAGSEGRPAASLVRDTGLRRRMMRAAAGREVEPLEVAVDDRRILTVLAPLPDGGAVATLVDLTDLRRLEEVRRDFVANASHELKTPLTSIRGYAETLLRGEPSRAERREFLEIIARNAGRLQRIVDDLLDLSRLEAGRWRPDLETVDVARAAERAWKGVEERGREKGITLAIDVIDGSVATADSRALEQVFANLYDNALRHTAPDAGGRVAVRMVRAPSDDGSWLVVEVSDTGSGIPRDALPRVFERFYRVDPARSRAEGGTGLGLSIVRHLMECMGGGVAAESELGKGTTIRLWLPTGEHGSPRYAPVTGE